mgnify:CR=1 FL=1
MSVDTLYNYSTATTTLTREHYLNFGAAAAQLGTYKRAFLGSTNFEIWTSSAGGSSMVEGVDYTLGSEDTRLTALLGSTVYTMLTMLTHTSTDIYITYKAVGSYTDAAAFNTAFVSLVPTGCISMFASTTAPTGWLYCDGTAYARTDYAALYSVISSAYGATSTSDFKVPDLRGRFAKGAGTSTGVDAAGNFYAGVLSSANDDRMALHEHGTLISTGGGGLGLTSTNYLAYVNLGANVAPTVTSPLIGGPVSSGSMAFTPRSSNTTEPQSLGVGYIIKY